MSNILYTLKKVYRAWLEYQSIDSPEAIGIYANPDDASLDPGIQTGEIQTTNCLGERVTALIYPDGINGKVNLSFPAAGPELESLFLGRRWEVRQNVKAPVLIEARGTERTIPGRGAGFYGFTITAQNPSTSKARGYWIDPATKLAVDIELVAGGTIDGTSTNEFAILANGAIEISDDLFDKDLQILVPDAVFPSATVLTGKQIGIISAHILGISFDGTPRIISIRNMSVQYGESLKSDPKRSLSFSILRDPGDGTGLGFSMIDLPIQMAC